MLKTVIRIAWSLLLILGLIGLIPATGAAAQTPEVACEQEYTVKSGDWLSSIAAETYGDATSYPAIVQATNAQPDDQGFANVENPNIIEIGATLCLPSQSEAQSLLDQTGQTGQQMNQAEQTGQMSQMDQSSQMQQGEQAGETEQSELTAPAGEMLMVLLNQSKANAPSTFTISGGQYGGGEQITVDSGERLELNLEPGDYRVIWSSPAAEDISFGRDFTAVAGTVARARIIPEKEQVFFNFNVNPQQQQQQQAQTQQMSQTPQQTNRPEEQLTPSADEMLLLVNNFSKANAPSTFTISGGEYGGGEQITVDAGEEVVLRLMPAEYRVIWSSPAAEDISFGRTFTAVPGTVARARIIPEQEQVAFRFNVRQDQTGQPAEQMQEAAQQQEATQMEEGAQSEQMTGTAEASQIDREFPYEAPAGQGMLVVGNRSIANVPSTLTISGGRFGGGEQITVDPGDEIFLPVQPGEFTVQWSAPIDQANEAGGESVIVSRQVQISAGETPFWWIVPEEFRAFSQSEGESPMELVP